MCVDVGVGVGVGVLFGLVPIKFCKILLFVLMQYTYVCFGLLLRHMI